MRDESCGRLNALFTFRGPCGICGGPDARHRLWDSLIDCHRAGDSIESIALNFRLAPEAVKAVIQCYIDKENPHAETRRAVVSENRLR
jgi:hypothetical protein